MKNVKMHAGLMLCTSPVSDLACCPLCSKLVDKESSRMLAGLMFQHMSANSASQVEHPSPSVRV